MIKTNFTTMALVLTAVLAFTGSVSASEELAKKSGCTACHAVDKKLVGPAFSDVATKYKGLKGAEVTLAAKIKKGGSGVWGVIPMPANTSVSDEDALALSKWVLKTK